MNKSEVTSPIILDQTGQDILEQLRLIAQNKSSISATDVTVAPNLTSGTLIGAIKINNDVYGLYIPSTDTSLSTTSNNYVANSVVTAKLNELESKIVPLTDDLADILDAINRKVV